MRGKIRAAGLVGFIAVGGLLTAGTAAAAPGRSPAPAPACGPHVVGRDVPIGWIPRSPSEQDRRYRWSQVSRWDADRDDRLSDREIAEFRKSGERVPGGPDCSRPEDPRR